MKKIRFVYVAVLAGASITMGGCGHTQLASVRDAVDTTRDVVDTAVHVHDAIEQIRGMRDAFQRFERMR